MFHFYNNQIPNNCRLLFMMSLRKNLPDTSTETFSGALILNMTLALTSEAFEK